MQGSALKFFGQVIKSQILVLKGYGSWEADRTPPPDFALTIPQGSCFTLFLIKLGFVSCLVK